MPLVAKEGIEAMTNSLSYLVIVLERVFNFNGLDTYFCIPRIGIFKEKFDIWSSFRLEVDSYSIK